MHELDRIDLGCFQAAGALPVGGWGRRAAAAAHIYHGRLDADAESECYRIRDKLGVRSPHDHHRIRITCCSAPPNNVSCRRTWLITCRNSQPSPIIVRKVCREILRSGRDWPQNFCRKITLAQVAFRLLHGDLICRTSLLHQFALLWIRALHAGLRRQRAPEEGHRGH
jgi:hypothetical protein